jgi:alpha-1,4-glucan:alpha-1,4-glucan 6-glycosyltransferase
LDLEEATDVVHGMHRNPHALLGAHEHDGHVTIRTLQPEADDVTVLLPGGRTIPMNHETGGIWVAVLPEQTAPAYRLHVASGGRRRVLDEAYRHGPSLGATDLHLIGEGRHEELWRALGSHVITVRDDLGEVTGTRFAVWAPNAIAVHVIGDFNGWNGATHALRAHDDVGVWELFVPGVREGAHYKYDITGPDGVRRAKADPMARASEVPPFNNSVVTVSRHRWSHGDAEWMEARKAGDVHHGPMSVYEVHLGSWKQGLGYEELADELVDHVASLGFTHVEFMPVMQHPYGGSWGYHVTGYYAADSRFGHEDGLRYLIDRLHCAGIGVILDWVPGHFATDPWALARFDGTPIYEHPDPRKGWHPEWGSYIFDYGRPEVRNFLVANATYWLEEFHADGLRVDGVASMLYLDYSRQPGQWLPNQHGGRENLEAVALLQEANATAYRRSPGVVMIAEESTSWPGVTAPTDEGGLGFGFKWNMGWMHDTLSYVGESTWARGHHHQALTFSIVYAFGEKYILPVSHDEVVHGKGSLVRKMSGDAWAKFATTRAFLAYQWTHPGKQLLFMGSEFAQVREWAEEGSLSWELLARPEHAGVQTLVRDLNRIYRDKPALWEIDHHADGFTWLDANDASRNIYSYLRWGNEDEDGLRPVLAVLVNFSGATHTVHTGLPYGGRWREVLNTDAEVYAGAGIGNLGGVDTVDHPHHRQPWSAMVTVPAYGAVVLEPESVHQEDWAVEAKEEPVEAPGGEQDTTPVLETGVAPTAGALTVGAGEDVAGVLPAAPSTQGPTAAEQADPDGPTTEPADLGDGSTTELAHGELPADHPFVTEGGQPIDHAEGEPVDLDGTGDASAEGVAGAPTTTDDGAFDTFGVTPEQDHELDEPTQQDGSGDRPATGSTDRGTDPS